jgi:hypothetical protein
VNFLIQQFVPTVAEKTREWIVEQRELFLPQARALEDSERSGLAGYFSEKVRSSARVAFADKVPNPPFVENLIKQLAFIGKKVQFDFSTAAGITFGECIVIAGRALPIDLLFHEMVHVEQYEQLGVPGFARAYIDGIVAADFVYESIPLEAIAFSMSSRFVAGEKFNVAAELTPWLQSRKYSR